MFYLNNNYLLDAAIKQDIEINFKAGFLDKDMAEFYDQRSEVTLNEATALRYITNIKLLCPDAKITNLSNLKRGVTGIKDNTAKTPVVLVSAIELIKLNSAQLKNCFPHHLLTGAVDAVTEKGFTFKNKNVYELYLKTILEHNASRSTDGLKAMHPYIFLNEGGSANLRTMRGQYIREMVADAKANLSKPEQYRSDELTESEMAENLAALENITINLIDQKRTNEMRQFEATETLLNKEIARQKEQEMLLAENSSKKVGKSKVLNDYANEGWDASVDKLTDRLINYYSGPQRSNDPFGEPQRRGR